MSDVHNEGQQIQSFRLIIKKFGLATRLHSKDGLTSMSILRFAIWLLAFGIALPAATLERLSLDQMIAKSTAIVRGRVAGSYAATRGPIIYTHYRIRVSENWKGSGSGDLDVVVPGGSAGGLRQVFSGAPKLTEDAEYVLFLWTGRSGLTHIIGLSQGVFDLQRDSSGALVAIRAASSEMMLDSTGQTLRDEAVRMNVSELRQRVSSALAGSTVK